MREMKMNENENSSRRIIDRFENLRMNLNKSITIEIRKICFNFFILYFEVNMLIVFINDELCLNKMKSEKILMKIRSDSDVQIDRQI